MRIINFNFLVRVSAINLAKIEEGVELEFKHKKCTCAPLTSTCTLLKSTFLMHICTSTVYNAHVHFLNAQVRLVHMVHFSSAYTTSVLTCAHVPI